jgi:branched-chain amino acid transport system permease protein
MEYDIFGIDMRAVFIILCIVLGTLVVVVASSFIFAGIKDKLSTRQKSILGNVILVCLGICLALCPLSGYPEGILILLCINAIAVMGVSLLTGFTGIFSLGHAAYMAIGAYTTASLTIEYGVHWIPAILASGVIAMIIAWPIGALTLRHEGNYYTIASVIIAGYILSYLNHPYGVRGISGIPTFTSRYVAVGFFIVMGLIIFNLINSKHGREFKAARDDVTTASMMGFNTRQIRVCSLVISALYCSIAGALMAGFTFFIQSSMFDMSKSTELTSVVALSGLGSMSGTIIGSTIITLITELFRPISQHRELVYGLILVLVMVLKPEGILGNREIWELFPDGRFNWRVKQRSKR